MFTGRLYGVNRAARADRRPPRLCAEAGRSRRPRPPERDGRGAGGGSAPHGRCPATTGSAASGPEPRRACRDPLASGRHRPEPRGGPVARLRDRLPGRRVRGRHLRPGARRRERRRRRVEVRHTAGRGARGLECLRRLRADGERRSPVSAPWAGEPGRQWIALAGDSAQSVWRPCRRCWPAGSAAAEPILRFLLE